jgi:hypothetical protein
VPRAACRVRRAAGGQLNLNAPTLRTSRRQAGSFSRVNFGKLEIEVTVDDPKAYTRPWTVKLNHFIALDTDLLDYFCLENEKDVGRLVGK